MNLNCETILDFYTHKDKKILCQIKVMPSKSHNNTCRCLTREEWNKFDKKLEKLITTTDNWSDEKYHTFNIKPYIEVKVQKSKLSLKHFHSCLGAIGGFDKDADGNGLVEANYVLECLFNFQSEAQVNPYIYESQEYDPQIEASQDNSLSYEPYTPSKKKYRADNIDTVKTPGTDLLKTNEDTCSQKDLSEIAKASPLYSEKIHKYTPASIKVTTRSSRSSSKSSQSDILNEVIVETGNEINSPQKYKSKKSKIKSNYIPESQEFCKIDVPAQFPSLVEETTQRKRCNTIDEIPGLREENRKEKCETIRKQLDRLEKYSHYEKIKLKKRSKSIDERQSTFVSKFDKPKLKKIIPEESSNKPLESINETKIYKTKKIKKDSNEVIPTIKNKSINKNPERDSSSYSDDEFLAAHKKSKMASKTNSKTSDDEFEDDNELNKNIKLKESNDNVSNLNISVSSSTESTTDTSPPKGRRGRKPKENNTTNAIISLRRSERSPSKPIRFREDPPSPVKKDKSKKHKTSLTNKELFGTDDDDDYFEKNNADEMNNENKKIKSSSVFETPVSKKSHKNASSSSSPSTKKKHKRDKSSECEQEKRDISKWLSKKKSSSVDKDKEKTSKEKPKSSFRSLPLNTSKKSRKNDVNTEENCSNSPKKTFEIPSKEEMELIRNKTKLMQKENAKVRAELDKMRTSPPKEVEILSLQNIPEADILKTFSTHKSELDEIYENNRKRDYIKGHDGINHCFVIRLLQPNIQMKMLQKLTDVYSNTNNTTQATLFANALLPEWVIRVYMEKFKFTRQEAINQIKAQEEFQLHMEEQSDNSFMFD